MFHVQEQCFAKNSVQKSHRLTKKLCETLNNCQTLLFLTPVLSLLQITAVQLKKY